MTSTQAILDSIENRLKDLNSEIETLAAARSALDGEAVAPARQSAAAPAARRSRAASRQTSTTPASEAAAPPARARPSARRSARRSNGRTTEVVPAGRLELLLSEDGGLTTTALVEQTNGDRDQVLSLLRELESAGRIRRTGQRRSTRWHAITDEDRIRERAAELAGRRKRPA